MRFYKVFKQELQVENYVVMDSSSSERSILANIRLGILPFKVETGRFNNTQPENSLCQMCNDNEIEDETHFLSIVVCMKWKEIPFFENV